MRVGRKAKRLVSNLFRRQQKEAALEAELRAYVKELAERNLVNGVSREEAQRQALLEAGGIEQVKEEVRASWIGYGIATTLQDTRYAGRSMLRLPGFTVLVMATLALGIGANLTMFGLLRAVLWRSLPYPQPNRIVVLHVSARNIPNTGATPGEVLDLRDRCRSFEQVSMINAVDANFEFQGETEHLEAASVSDNFLPLLGARPALGRTLNSRIDEGKEDARAILISDELWRRRFSSDPAVLGKAVRVNSLEVQIVGVLPHGFRLFLPPDVGAAEQVDIWFPAALKPTRQYRGIPVAARLRQGVTLAQANAELQTLAAQFEREYPDFYSGGKGWQASPADHGPDAKLRFTASLLHDEITQEAKPALFLLSGAVGFVLLIACINTANLMLARGSARQRELEIRRALGAGQIRIMRQLLTESLLLALGSAIIGLSCARLGLAAMGRVDDSHIPLQSRIEMDVPILLFALALSVFTSVLFGLLPAWRLASGKTGQALRTGRGGTTGAGARRLQRTLVVAEVALSIVPLACGGLMLRSFLNLLHTPLGFNPTNVITAKVPFSFKGYPQKEQQWALLRDVMDRLRALPQVQAVSAANPLPLAGDQETRRVGRLDQPDALPILATQQGAIPGYLGVIGTPLLAGRDFSEHDIATQRAVTIIDEELARRLWPNGGAIGNRLTVYRTGWRHELEVIGVTAAVRATRVRDGSIPHFMLPDPFPQSLIVKTYDTSAQMAPRIQHAVAAAHVGRAAFDIKPMSDYVADSMGDTRFILFLLTMFAGGSVLLAALGLYGTLAYLTVQRTREFGIRLALGSSIRAIVAIVLRESTLLAVAGIVLGLVAASAVARSIRQLLYGVQPLDGGTLLGVVALVAVVALGAAGLPAWRAARIDPQESLRAE